MSLVGTTLAGRYRILSLLGEGGMGAVYAAEQMLGSTARKIAIKTLHQHLTNDPKLRARFEREASTIAGLEHPNTIQIYDFGATEDGTLYLVMEYATGRSLADVLEKERSLDPVRATSILKQICGSLEEAHRAGIVHRDLKPENIMLTERAGQHDFVKVLDFGIARRMEDDVPGKKLTQAGTVLGTPPYMSPEQFTGQDVSPASDIYSLGVIAYEMVTGELPFQASTSWDWATAHMTQPPKPFDQTPRGAAVPVAYREAVYKALQKAPSARFASVSDFAAALDGSAPLSKVALTVSDRPPRPGGTEIGAPVVVVPVDAMARPGGTQMGEAIDPAMMMSPAAPPVGAPVAVGPGYGPGPGAGYPPAGYYPPPQQHYGHPEKKSRTGLVIALLGALAVCGGLITIALVDFGDSKEPVVLPMPTVPAPSPEPAPEPSPSPTPDEGLGGLPPAAPSPTPSPAPVSPAPKPKPSPAPPSPAPAPPAPAPNPWFPPAPAPGPAPAPAPPTPNPTPKPNPTPGPSPTNDCAGKTGAELRKCRTGF